MSDLQSHERPMRDSSQRLSLAAARREAARMQRSGGRRAVCRAWDYVVGGAALLLLAFVAATVVAVVVWVVVQLVFGAVGVPRWEFGLLIWVVLLGLAWGEMNRRRGT
jgi:Flp pilus assembly protein TadB